MERHFHGGLEGSWTFVAKASRTGHLKTPKLLRYQARDLQRPLVPRLVRARSLQRRGLRRHRLARHSLLRGLIRRAHRYQSAREKISHLEPLSVSRQLSYLDQLLLSLIPNLAASKREKRRGRVRISK